MKLMKGLIVAAMLMLPAAMPKPKPKPDAVDLGYLLSGFLEGCEDTPALAQLKEALYELLGNDVGEFTIDTLALNRVAAESLGPEIIGSSRNCSPREHFPVFFRRIDCAREIVIPLEGKRFAGLAVAELSLGLSAECDYRWDAIVFNASLEEVLAKIGAAVDESAQLYEAQRRAGGVFLKSRDGGTRSYLLYYTGA